MISTELIEELFGDFVDLEVYKSNSSIDIVSQGVLCLSINIYELAHKCKEWAKHKDCDVWSGWDTDNYIAKVNPDFDDEQDYWCEDKSEPEAIFKACQWILENR